MESKRLMLIGGEIVDAPGHWKITLEDSDNDREWSVIRKPEGTYWELASTDYFPRTGGFVNFIIGNQIVDEKTLSKCEKNYMSLQESLAKELCANSKCGHERGQYVEGVCYVDGCTCANFIRHQQTKKNVRTT